MKEEKTLSDKRKEFFREFEVAKNLQDIILHQDKQFIKEILDEIDTDIKDIKLSLDIRKKLEKYAGKNAFIDIEEKERFSLVVLEDIKETIKQKAGGDLVK